MLSNLRKSIIKWIPIATAITLCCGAVYAGVQQDLRLTANDPQVQIAEDTAAKLATVDTTPSATASPSVDMAKSLATYVILYNGNGQPVSSTVSLNGKTPSLPSGVFTYTLAHGEDRFTWQPETGVRSAAVVVHYGGPHPGFVLVGRSLREIEDRENHIKWVTAGIWGIAMAVTLGEFLVWDWLKARKRRTTA